MARSGGDGTATRRMMLGALGAAAVAGTGLRPAPAGATPESARALVDGIVAGRTPIENGVRLELPEIAENGSSVPVTIAVESPMTVDDHVTALHLVSERNPEALIATARFTPTSGRAALATRMRLAESQTVWAVAETSTGAVLVGRRRVTVTVGGCEA